ncbi:hypothetical protein [Siminovitchia sp. 179-K 8D1 HS]
MKRRNKDTRSVFFRSALAVLLGVDKDAQYLSEKEIKNFMEWSE